MPEDELDGFGADIDEFFGDSGKDSEERYTATPPPPPVRPPQTDSRGKPGTWVDGLRQGRGGKYLKTLLNVVVLLVIVVGAAHAFYSYLFASERPQRASRVTTSPPAAEQTQAPDSGPPVAAPVVAATPSVPDEEGDFAIQIGMCLYPSCVTNFQERLRPYNLETQVTEVPSTYQTVEVYSLTPYQTREQAQAMVDRINGAQILDEQAYVRTDSNVVRISMGNFDNPVRANSVMDSLNSFLLGAATFTTRVWEFPQTLHSIVAGHFRTRREAEAALSRLVQGDSVFAESRVVSR
jgi:cell division septation protein DedD